MWLFRWTEHGFLTVQLTFSEFFLKERFQEDVGMGIRIPKLTTWIYSFLFWFSSVSGQQRNLRHCASRFRVELWYGNWFSTFPNVSVDLKMAFPNPCTKSWTPCDSKAGSPYAPSDSRSLENASSDASRTRHTGFNNLKKSIRNPCERARSVFKVTVSDSEKSEENLSPIHISMSLW
jgi:hypothetical protein